MSIWLSYIDENASPPGSEDNEIRNLIEAMNGQDEEISALEVQLNNELGKIDENINREDEFSNIYSGGVKSTIDEIADRLIELDAKMKDLEKSINEQYMNTKDSNINSARGRLHTLRIDRVTNLLTTSNRWLTEHRIPGRAYINEGLNSSIIQDFGRVPVRLSFNGILTSKDDGRKDLRDKVETLKWFFDRQYALYFSSKLVNQADVSKVKIVDLKIEETTSSPYFVEINCSLCEYQDPVPQVEDTEIESKLREQVRVWSEFQVLKVATRYRLKFLRGDGENTSEDIALKIADGVIRQNLAVKDKI